MKKNIIYLVLFVLLITGIALVIYNKKKSINNKSLPQEISTQILPGVYLSPIEHASAVLSWGERIIYIDPVGGGEKYVGYPQGDIILITHQHGDHFDIETLESLVSPETILLVPSAVLQELSPLLLEHAVRLNNNEDILIEGLSIQAIPSYNIRQEALKNHPEGRDNGYLLSDNQYRVYFSGDSGPTDEMKSLKNIDIAFVAMNLPYTMSIESAAQAVLEFVPASVYPYHYRTPEGFSNVEQFKTLVEEANANIEVVLLNWYD